MTRQHFIAYIIKRSKLDGWFEYLCKVYGTENEKFLKTKIDEKLKLNEEIEKLIAANKLKSAYELFDNKI